MVKLTYNLGRGETTMIIDITGLELTPGNHGRDCAGNAPDIICCDECDYYLWFYNKCWGQAHRLAP